MSQKPVMQNEQMGVSDLYLDLFFFIKISITSSPWVWKDLLADVLTKIKYDLNVDVVFIGVNKHHRSYLHGLWTQPFCTYYCLLTCLAPAKHWVSPFTSLRVQHLVSNNHTGNFMPF